MASLFPSRERHTGYVHGCADEKGFLARSYLALRRALKERKSETSQPLADIIFAMASGK